MHLDDLKRDVALREANLINRRALAVADAKRLAAAANAAATPLRIGVVGLATGFLMGRGGPTTAVGNHAIAASITSTIGLIGALVQQVTSKKEKPPAHTAAGAADESGG